MRLADFIDGQREVRVLTHRILPSYLKRIKRDM